VLWGLITAALFSGVRLYERLGDYPSTIGALSKDGKRNQAIAQVCAVYSPTPRKVGIPLPRSRLHIFRPKICAKCLP
jgi:hypothetical protein